MTTSFVSTYIMLPLAYDGEPEPRPDPLAKDGPLDKDDPKVKALLDAELTRQRAEYRSHQEKLVAEIEHLKKTSNLTNDERKKLDGRLESLSNELLTTKERAEREAAKAKQEHESALSQATAERDSAKKKYEDLLIQNELVSAATAYKAYNPDQVISQVRDNTSLKPILDEDGNDTGEVAVLVDITTQDGDGKTVTLSMPPKDAIKRMTEDERHANLFLAKGKDGLGFRPRGDTGKLDLAQVAKDPEKIRELYKAGKLK